MTAFAGRNTVLLFAGVLGLMGCSAWAANDYVKVRGKAQVYRGTVLKDTLIEVQIRTKGGGTVTLPGKDVVKIKYDIGHGEWIRAMGERSRGAYGSAAESFDVLSGKDTLITIRKVARPYVIFLWGDSLYRAGKAKESVKVFQGFLKKYPTSRYSSIAVGSLVDAAIQTKNYTIVPPLLAKLKKTGTEGRAKALYHGGQMLLAQGKATPAGGKFGEAAAASRDPETKALARLGQARCAILKKDLAKAKSMAEQALASSKNAAVSGTAHMIVGKVLYAEAAKLKGTAAEMKYLDAVLEFMRIPVTYGGDRRTEPEALYLAGQCFVKLSKFPTRRKDSRRAKSLYLRILTNYKGTRWASKAKKDMKKIR